FELGGPMRRFVAACLIFLGGLAPIHARFLVATASQSNGDSQTPPAKFTVDQLRADFQLLRTALEEGHSGIYRYTKKAELDRIFDSAFQKLDRPMDDLELFRIVVPVVASIKCGHTRAALPAKRMTQVTESIRLLPLKVRVIDKKPFVFRDFALRDFA